MFTGEIGGFGGKDSQARGQQVKQVVLLERTSTGASTGNNTSTASDEGEEESVFTRESITNEDPPNAHQAQHRPKPRVDECVASVRT